MLNRTVNFPNETATLTQKDRGSAKDPGPHSKQLVMICIGGVDESLPLYEDHTARQ